MQHWSESILQQTAGYGAPPPPPTFLAASGPPHLLPPPPPPPPPERMHYSAQPPIHYSPQPPPPPLRSITSHPSSRRTSSFGDGSFLGANLGVERSCSSGQEAGMVGGQARPSVLGGGGEETLSLTKLSQEMYRIEYEAQSQLHAMVQEINKLKKDREVSWKHVVELKEQNQLLRDRLREQREQPLRDLEAQNAALMAQNQSMATALNAIQERLGPLMSLASHLQQGGQLPLMTSQQQPTKVPHVPHVPHSGANIW